MTAKGFMLFMNIFLIAKALRLAIIKYRLRLVERPCDQKTLKRI